METKALDLAEKTYAEGATAPRITLDYLKSQIASVHYMDGDTFTKHANWTDWIDKLIRTDTTTIVMMILKSGFVVIGSSTPISKDNYDAAKGRLAAYENCIRQLWPLYGFAAVATGSVP